MSVPLANAFMVVGCNHEEVLRHYRSNESIRQTVLFHYPPEQNKSALCGLIHAVQPDGVILSQTYKPPIITPNLCMRPDGAYFHVVSLSFWEPFYDTYVTGNTPPPAYSQLDASHNKSQNPPAFYVLKSLSLKADVQHGFVDAMSNCLSTIYAIHLLKIEEEYQIQQKSLVTPESDAPFDIKWKDQLEKAIARLIHEVRVPLAGGLPVQISLGFEDIQACKPSLYPSIPTSGTHVRQLFQKLGLHNTLQVFFALTSCTPILLVSSSHTRLFWATHALRTMAYPLLCFDYGGLDNTIPVGGEMALHHYVLAECHPFLMGVTPAIKNKILGRVEQASSGLPGRFDDWGDGDGDLEISNLWQFKNYTVIANLDTGAVQCSEQCQILWPPEPVLSNTIALLLRILQPDLQGTDSLFGSNPNSAMGSPAPPLPTAPPPGTPSTPSTSSPIDPSSRSTPNPYSFSPSSRELFEDKQLRAVFIRLFARLLSYYRYAISTIRLDPPRYYFQRHLFMGMKGLHFKPDKEIDKCYLSYLLENMVASGASPKSSFIMARQVPFRDVDIFDEVVDTIEDQLEKEAIAQSTCPDPEVALRMGLDHIKSIAEQLMENERPNDGNVPFVSKPFVVPTQQAQKNAQFIHFPELSTEKIEAFGKEMKPMEIPRCAPPNNRLVPMTHPPPRWWNIASNPVAMGPVAYIERVFEHIMTQKVQEARKMMKKARAHVAEFVQCRWQLCILLNETVQRYKQVPLESAQFELLVDLVRIALTAETSNDENGVAMALLYITSDYFRPLRDPVSGSSASQYLYTAVQGPEVWDNVHFFLGALFSKVTKTLYFEYVKGDQLANGPKEFCGPCPPDVIRSMLEFVAQRQQTDMLTKRADADLGARRRKQQLAESSSSEANTTPSSAGENNVDKECPKKGTDESGEEDENNKCSDDDTSGDQDGGTLTSSPVPRQRSSHRRSKQGDTMTKNGVVPQTQLETNPARNASSSSDSSSFTDSLKNELDAEAAVQFGYCRDFVFSRLLHLQLPLDPSAHRIATQLMSLLQDDSSVPGAIGSAPTHRSNMTADLESRSESGIDEREVANQQNDVHDRINKFIKLFAEYAGLRWEKVREISELRQRITDVLMEYVYDLEKVYKLLRDLTTANATRDIDVPTLLPGERLVGGALRCVLEDDGRLLGYARLLPGTTRNENLSMGGMPQPTGAASTGWGTIGGPAGYQPSIATGYTGATQPPYPTIGGSATLAPNESGISESQQIGAALLPAEGLLFLTNYRIVFQGFSASHFTCDQAIVKSFPVASLKREKHKNQVEEFTSAGVAAPTLAMRSADKIQIRSNACDILKITFYAHIGGNHIRDFFDHLRHLRLCMPCSVCYGDYPFAIRDIVPDLLNAADSSSIRMKRYKPMQKRMKNLGIRYMNRGFQKMGLQGFSLQRPDQRGDTSIPPRSLALQSRLASGRSGAHTIGPGGKTIINPMGTAATTSAPKASFREKLVFNEFKNQRCDAMAVDLTRLNLGEIETGGTSKKEGMDKCYRITTANAEFKASQTYPPLLSVPGGVKDDGIREMAKTHKESRFPVAVWRHPETKAILLRAAGFNFKKMSELTFGIPSADKDKDPDSVTLKPPGEQDKYFTKILAAASFGKVQEAKETVHVVPDVITTENSNRILLNIGRTIAHPQRMFKATVRSIAYETRLAAKKWARDQTIARVEASLLASTSQVPAEGGGSKFMGLTVDDTERDLPPELGGTDASAGTPAAEFAGPTGDGEIRKVPLYILGDGSASKHIKLEKDHVEFMALKYPRMSDIKDSWKLFVENAACPAFTVRHVGWAVYRPGSQDLSDAQYLAHVASSGWLKRVQEVLRGAAMVTELIDQHAITVMLAMEDGRDSVALISSIAQILMDPYYRKIEGLRVLIEKEWLSFGHRWWLAGGQAAPDGAPEERVFNPSFILFLDCLHQLLVQFPLSFEYNSFLLSYLGYHSMSGMHTTFLRSCEFERVNCGLEEDMNSVWNAIEKWHVRWPFFYSFSYKPVLAHSRILVPNLFMSAIDIWDFYKGFPLGHLPSYELELMIELGAQIGGGPTPNGSAAGSTPSQLLNAVYQDPFLVLSSQMVRNLRLIRNYAEQDYDPASLRPGCVLCEREMGWLAAWLPTNMAVATPRENLQSMMSALGIGSEASDNLRRQEARKTLVNKRSIAALEGERHQFKRETFVQPRTCDVCHQLMWTNQKKSAECVLCQFSCHEDCKKKAPNNCDLLRPPAPDPEPKSKDAGMMTEGKTPKKVISGPSKGLLSRDGVEVKGYLYKQQRIWKHWVKRYYVLNVTDYKLYCCEDRQAAEVGIAKTYTPLNRITWVTTDTHHKHFTEPPDPVDKDAFFTLCESDGTRKLFAAPSKESAKEWVKGLNQFIN